MSWSSLLFFFARHTNIQQILFTTFMIRGKKKNPTRRSGRKRSKSWGWIVFSHQPSGLVVSFVGLTCVQLAIWLRAQLRRAAATLGDITNTRYCCKYQCIHFFIQIISITPTAGLHIPACLSAHMVACLVHYVIWTAGTLADPAVIDWSQAHIDKGLRAWQSLWRNKL